jgi:glycosyltransferase involved in cell wall biosynthesis
MNATICLNMIVKNEAHVIRRCLESARPFIDRWVIVDTGSNDGTQELVIDTLQDVPGELYQRPWRDFGQNRTEALELARCCADYLLFIDADEKLQAPSGFSWPALGGDAYNLPTDYSGISYSRCALVSTRLAWRWVGVVHEYLAASPEARIEPLEWPRIVVSHDGARSRDPSTYAKDAAVLEKAIAAEPQNTRYAFYLAQSYRDARMFDKSRAAYLRRANMGGWDEEVWYSLYQVGRLSETLGADCATIVQAYLAAFQNRPSRAEPLYQLARFHRARGEFALAYMFARHGAAIPRPSDTLFVEEDVYRWRLLDEVGTAGYYVGAMADGRNAILRLLAEGHIPNSDRPRIEGNLNYYRDYQPVPVKGPNV